MQVQEILPSTTYHRVEVTETKLHEFMNEIVSQLTVRPKKQLETPSNPANQIVHALWQKMYFYQLSTWANVQYSNVKNWKLCDNLRWTKKKQILFLHINIFLLFFHFVLLKNLNTELVHKNWLTFDANYRVSLL